MEGGNGYNGLGLTPLLPCCKIRSVTVLDTKVSTPTPVRLSRPPPLIGQELLKDHPMVFSCSLLVQSNTREEWL